MLFALHITGGARVSRLAIAALLAALIAAGTTPTVAQDSQPDNQPALADSVRAFMTARQWINDFDLPSTDDCAALLPINGASGISIALRHSGRLVGSGIDNTNDPISLRRATGRALSELLGDETMRNVPESLRHTVGGKLNLELEVAGPLQPLLARNVQQIARQYEPGLDGLAMRRGESLAMLFPSQMLRRGNADNIDGAVSRLAAQLSLKPAPLNELIDRRKVSLYRFRTVHLVQDSPTESPRSTHRGLRIVSIDEVTPESIRAFADAAAQHLVNKFWTGEEPLGLMGDYDPLRDQYQPMFAAPRDQALAALALESYAATTIHRQRAETAMQIAREIFSDLSIVDSTEADPFDDTATAAMMLSGAPTHTADDVDIVAALDRAQRNIAPITRLENDELNAALRELDPTTRGMIAAAMYSDRFEDAAALRVLNAVFNVTTDQELVATMPWNYIALMASSVGDNPQGTQVAVCERMRLALWNRQIKHPAAPRLSEAHNSDWVDLVGGFILTGEPTATRDRPSAQSARMAALLALMFSDDGSSSDADRDITRRNQLLAMRYLMQLQIMEHDAWAFRDPERALGGIRSNTWASDLPTAATAMALLAAVYTDLALAKPHQNQ